MAISFAQSERSTLGVEWELQLIDVDSEDLRQCAQAIITQVSAQYPGNTLVHGEMLRNTVELVSRKQTRVRDAIADLNEGLEMLEPITSALRVDLTSAGSHPFANPAHQRVSDSKRYAELVNRTQFWGRQMLIFGTHVHVGIEERSKVLPLLLHSARANPSPDGLVTLLGGNGHGLLRQSRDGFPAASHGGCPPVVYPLGGIGTLHSRHDAHRHHFEF